MTDNVVTSSSLDAEDPKKKPAKKAVPKKAAVKKVEAEKETSTVSEDKVYVFFESGVAYNSGNLRFTRDNPLQAVTPEQAELLLSLDNFRRPDQLELEEYLASKED